MSRHHAAASLFAVTLVLTAVLPAFAGPIASSGAATTLPAYSGAAAAAKPLKVDKPPKHPFMARNGRSNLHNDPWMTDTYWGKGPVGRDPQVFSTSLGRDCISIAFDRSGRIVTACSNLSTRVLYVIEPGSLRTLAQVDLPYVEAPPGQDPFTSSSGGVYFYLDNKDRAVIGAADGRILIYQVNKSAPYLSLAGEYDLSGVLAGDRITSVLPDWQGRAWFVGRYSGIVGVLDLESGETQSITLGEEIENSFAVDEDAVYIVSDTSMYRFAAGADNVPAAVWSQPYQNSGVQKTGQFNAGSGTTPTIMNGGYVAITDNADPMNVVVYRKDAALAPGQDRVVCEVPVFSAGASATENSLIAVGNSLIVENNYGYYLLTTLNGPVSSPGITRIDVAEDGSGCEVVWTSTERAPSCVPKVSTKTGLVYLYTKDPDPVNTTSDAWFWTALDFRTGATVWKQLAGTGLSFNNHYAGIALRPKTERAAYVGTVGGIVAIRDGD
ncbi:MAG TPA: hypothetical protein VN634_00180 [Candidatus Limnocylindrales bacterium]|nr:hypothetical protein [Candidatus Limnocylindrales bacterium]